MLKIKDRIASALGSVLEWYDFALYGFFAPILAKLYFPSQLPLMGLLKVFSVFAVGFIARPFGALIFGVISDKHGRITTLKITPILITIPTLLLAVLPNYQQIGMVAPVLFVLARIIQGICIGGEFANNIIYLCESTQQKHIYFLGSIGSCTGSLGIFLASVAATTCYSIFPHNILYSWGWRSAFLMSLIFGIITYILRNDLLESPVYVSNNKNNPSAKNPLKESLFHQKRDYLITFGLIFFPATAFYYVFVFMPSILNVLLGYNSKNILSDNSLSLFLRLLIIPIIGLTADKLGGIKIVRLSCLSFFLLSYPLFYCLLHYQNFIGVIVGTFAILTTLNAGTTPGLVVELLRPHTRSTILSLTFNICFGVFGGIVPIISLLLTQQLNCKMASVFYLMFAALITFTATFFLKRRNDHV